MRIFFYPDFPEAYQDHIIALMEFLNLGQWSITIHEVDARTMPTMHTVATVEILHGYFQAIIHINKTRISDPDFLDYLTHELLHVWLSPLVRIADLFAANSRESKIMTLLVNDAEETIISSIQKSLTALISQRHT